MITASQIGLFIATVLFYLQREGNNEKKDDD